MRTVFTTFMLSATVGNRRVPGFLEHSCDEPDGVVPGNTTLTVEFAALGTPPPLPTTCDRAMGRPEPHEYRHDLVTDPELGDGD
ncbi:hypothetical protein, partial [Streptomyces sp. NPDC006307]|uniref:hypothetical protein n=1 Tax=Streptomyces sp. NPDC006307 TaxID=3156748 RepID=UPI0033A37C95